MKIPGQIEDLSLVIYSRILKNEQGLALIVNRISNDIVEEMNICGINDCEYVINSYKSYVKSGNPSFQESKEKNIYCNFVIQNSSFDFYEMISIKEINKKTLKLQVKYHTQKFANFICSLGKNASIFNDYFKSMKEEIYTPAFTLEMKKVYLNSKKEL